MELTLAQLAIIGLVVTVVTAIIKLAVQYIKVQGQPIVLHRGWISVVAAVLSVGLAFVWALPKLPPYSDPMQFANDLLALAAGVMGFAFFIYNVLLDKLLKALGLSSTVTKPIATS